jgi:hypothetical protein
MDLVSRDIDHVAKRDLVLLLAEKHLSTTTKDHHAVVVRVLIEGGPASRFNLKVPHGKVRRLLGRTYQPPDVYSQHLFAGWVATQGDALPIKLAFVAVDDGHVSSECSSIAPLPCVRE